VEQHKPSGDVIVSSPRPVLIFHWPKRSIWPLPPTFQMIEDTLAECIRIDAALHQHLDGDAVPTLQKAEKKVLGGDMLMTKGLDLLPRMDVEAK